MEPKRELPTLSPEMRPSSVEMSAAPQAGEVRQSREYAGESSRELHAEVARQEIGSMPLPPPLPLPSDPSAQVAAPVNIADDAIPTVANDDDLIEKEWVDKAKKILAATKDDPYQREIEINKLQIEYVRKRYGREIGKVED